ncbi:uncharacterized protein C2orf80 homolog isoform X2 [Sphaerodactylus townsendi]|uniref:uncharacterized protein C2orf80 homolog isoform X2 n=1 Tax=Sphaerodactylus townsendi TaxID=933632 RepID=UPI0020266F3D|nr:uncharacterized protein C2orf80 homolog isoform X2 [Sphaerodactylus townsendi]
MERKHLKKEIGKLLVEYVGIRLRENAFDPQGKKQTNFLDDLAHHDLAANAALSWLSDLEAQTSLGNEKTKLSQWQKILSLNRTEREALILSSYAEMVMNSIPVEEVFRIYGAGPMASRWQSSTKGHLIHPRNLSRHPFAMLTAPKAAEHAWKQSSQGFRQPKSHQEFNRKDSRQ